MPADVIVAVRGPQMPVVVRQRTRIAGIWMNGASARFDNAPAYYALASTRPLAELLPEAERRRLRLGLDLLPLRPSELDVGDGFRRALIELKLQRGLYRQEDEGVRVTGERLFATRIVLPPTVPPGLYLVDVLGVQGGRVVASRDLTFAVRRVGTSAEIWRFANAHPWLYGFAAVIAAAVVGWAGSVVFRRA
ncbi:MAG: TIGR02186 family protein [Acetobacteraceae bacterium]|nr:TIGR02186 family protein [Acetobacteraceae bacterium]